MPAKTKKKPTASRPRSSVTKSNNILSTGVNKKRVLIVIAVLAVLGAFLMFRASAATTNYEAETASRNTLVSAPLSDATASGGKYVEFAQPITTASSTSSVQRFPGDPNPRVTGKAYWGGNVFALLANGTKTSDVRARHEVPTGKPYPIHHTYHNWGDISDGGMVNQARTGHAAGRLPYLTFKNEDWGAVGRGQFDADLDKLVNGLDALGKPVWIGLYHEPENNTNGSTRTPATWRAMQTRFKQRMNVANNGQGTKNIAFMPHFMAWTFSSSSGRNPNDWWADNTWDVIMFSNYCNTKCIESGGSSLTTTERANAIKYIEGKGMPWGLGEWSLSEKRTGPLRFTSTMTEYWNWGFKNNKDLVAYNYFDADESRPDPTSPYYASLRDANLDAFHAILKSDSRVMRLNDLNKASSTSPSTTSYGKITSSVNLPENGAYKLWARMKSGDATNNSAQAQIDNGIATNIGGASINSSSWTWVSMPAANLNAGTRTVTITGIQKGVKVDRVILTNETCVPTGTGDNCTLATPPTPTALKVSVSGITNGSTVSGVVPVKVSADRAISAVSFRPDNVWAQSDETNPYEFSWDTRSLSNGAHSLVIRTRADGDPGDVYTQTVFNVTVSNTTRTTPALAPVDSTKPTVPTSLRANLVFDWAQMKYVMNLDWDPSYDNVGVTGYQISRNGTGLGSSKTTDYTDATNLSAGALYTYSVNAIDAAGLKSNSTTISMVTKCVFISCTASVQ